MHITDGYHASAELHTEYNVQQMRTLDGSVFISVYIYMNEYIVHINMSHGKIHMQTFTPTHAHKRYAVHAI